ncbi:TonB-dependent receptor domain-containing protein, partial [Sphingobium rhizovicinum]
GRGRLCPDQIAISPMFDIVVGVRYEHFKTTLHDRRSLAFRTSGSTISPEYYDVTDNLWSPRAGLIFKPAENASIYASYSRTYQPRGGDQLTGLSLSNASWRRRSSRTTKSVRSGTFSPRSTLPPPSINWIATMFWR